MANITTTISNFPTPPNSSTDTPTEFNAKADSFVNHQANNYVDEVNAWADEANDVRDDINAIVATIPDGTIDDTTPSSINVYSSQKTQNELDGKFNKTAGALDNIPAYGADGELKDSGIASDNMGIESGTGYTKFPDGTLICTGELSVTVDATTADGALFRNIATEVPFVDFPIAFISSPVVTMNIKQGGSVNPIVASAWTITTSNFNYIVKTTLSSASTGVNMGWIAVGRWK